MKDKDSFWTKIKYAYWHTIPYDWRPGQIIYRLKCFVWYRYSTVRPRTLPHTWCDRSDLVPHTMFEILSQFVEKEGSPGPIEWYGEYGHKIDVHGTEVYVRDEMQELYDWWNTTYLKEYPKKEDELWEIAHQNTPIRDFIPLSEEEKDEAAAAGLNCEGWMEWSPAWESDESKARWDAAMDAVQALEKQAESELMDRMHRLVNLTPYMWT